MTPAPTTGRDGIAVIGMSCRFPSDADTPERFWRFICQGRNAYSENPQRWNPDAFHYPYPQKKINTSLPRGGHFLKADVAAFDANFFNISQVEAESIDPQQRLIMEVTYEALENGGIPIHQLAGSRTGVFMASFTSDYREMLCRDPETAPRYTATGTSSTATSNRASWFYDLRGPSFTVNTACSSGLVATHLACQSLWTGESETAIVGGTSLLLNPDMFLFFSNQQFLAGDGRSKSFAENGDGYGRGDGIGVVILKRVEDALRDGDPIRAVIRGTAVNQDGHTKGFTLPSADAQVQLIEDAYRGAGLSLAETRYVEAHGTGTRAGDSQEVEALSRTFCQHRTASDPLLVGSVKANIGHLEACAGLASLIKCVFVLETGWIPPTQSSKTRNPAIPSEVHVPATLMPWPTKGLRRVSTQGFGYGGTNAHIIIDDAYHYLHARGQMGHHYSYATPRTLTAKSNGRSSINNGSQQWLFRLQAQDKEGLKRVRAALSQHLADVQPDQEENYYLRDLAYTLNSRRSRLQWQTFAVAGSLVELSQALDDEPWANPEQRQTTVQTPRLGFVFTGQGAQWPRMGVELMAYEVFRHSVEQSDRYLRQELGCPWSAVEELAKPESLSHLHLASHSQALCSVLQIALVDLLSDWQIAPSAVTGHSSGEIAAAYCLGALTKTDALKVAYYRGLLASEMKQMDATVRGAMIAIGATPDQVTKWIDQLTRGEVVIACVNSPTSVTASGDAAAINELAAIVKKAGVWGRQLKVDTAYHSPHMQMIAAPYFELLADIEPRPAHQGRSMHSSVFGRQIDPAELGAVHWVRNLVSPVLFADAVSAMLKHVDLLVEVGPHSALQGPVRQTMQAHGVSGVEYVSVLSRGQSATRTALACAGHLLLAGIPVDLRRVNREDSPPRPVVDLPAYPWNHSARFWAESRLAKEFRLRQHPRLPLLGAPCPSMGARERHWRGMVRLSEEPWIRDHVIQDSILYPGAGLLVMAIEAAAQEAAPGRTISTFRLRDVRLDTALLVTDDEVEVILQLRPHLIATRGPAAAWMEFTVSSSADKGPLRQNCSGLIMVEYDDTPTMSRERALESAAIRTRFQQSDQQCRTSADVAQFYSRLRAMGLTYGPGFANLVEVRSRAMGECVGTIRIPQVESMVPAAYRDHPHTIHPATLDSIFHLALAAAIEGRSTPLPAAMVPISITEVVVSANVPNRPGTLLKGVAQSSPHGFREMISDIDVVDEQATSAVVQIKGFRCSEISGAQKVSGHAGGVGRPICFRLVWKPAIDLLSREELQAVLHDAATSAGHESSSLDESRAVVHFVQAAMQQVPADQVAASQASFYRWLKEQSTMLTNSTDPATEEEKTADEFSKIIGKDLAGILQGTITAPQLLEKADQIHRLLVSTAGFSEITRILDEYLTLRHHNDPGLSILEVGLTAQTPLSLVARLPSRGQILQTAAYTFSVPSEEAVPGVEQRFGSLREAVSIQVADLELRSQALDTTYDIIILFDPGYASTSPKDVLRTIRNLLKDSGKLVLVEINRPQLRLGTILGSLQWTRALETGQSAWEPCFPQAGLTPELTFTETQSRLVVSSVSQKEEKEAKYDEEVTLVEAPNPSPAAQRLATELVQQLALWSIPTRRFTWGLDDVAALKAQSCLVLTDLEAALLKNPSREDFVVAQSMILQADRLLWVSGPCLGPDSALVTGLARCVRNEVPGIRFRTLQVSGTPLTEAHAFANLVLRVWQSAGPDDEFLADSGLLQVSRLVEDESRNDELAVSLGQKERVVVPTPLGESPQALKLSVRQPGILDSLCFEPDDLLETPLADEEIEVELKATGINFRDVMVAMGQIPDSTFGLEGAGLVRRVGSMASAQYRPGDRVMFAAQGAHRTIFRVPIYCAVPMPETMSFEQAASLPLVCMTAWYGLVKTAHATAGQSVLIHAAAGGVGQATIMLAQHLGLEIFVTVGSDDKRQLVREVYHIPDDHIFHSRDLSFVKGIQRMTGGRGVDIILNSLSGETLRQTWYCIAPFGTFVEVGMKDILDNTRLDMRPFLQDATFAFFNLVHIQKQRPDLLKEALSETLALVHAGVMKPMVPLTVFPASQVQDALRRMQTGQHRGKLVLSYRTGDVLPVLCAPRGVRLASDGAYLLVGGLGGLGRSLARLFIRLGARQLCFLSRSGATGAEAQALLQELEEQQPGVRTLVCVGDVSDADSVAAAMQKCTDTLGTVRGVVQCAMVLRDALFAKMTHDQWIESTRPKVHGTWNLHQHLPKVDFFLVLSSFAGVFGNRGQSNYAAAGAYQDALAHYRRGACGQKAITLDLGIVRDVGVLAEKGITDSLREWEQAFGIREAEFHALVESAIATQQEQQPAAGAEPFPPPAVQISTGLATARSAMDAGINNPFYFDDARFSILARTGTNHQYEHQHGANGQSSLSVQTQLAQAQSLDEAAQLVQSTLLARVAKSLQSNVSDIDPGRPLHSFGVDSLVAVEVANWVFKELHATLTVFEVLASVPITALAEQIASRSGLVPKFQK